MYVYNGYTVYKYKRLILNEFLFKLLFIMRSVRLLHTFYSSSLMVKARSRTHPRRRKLNRTQLNDNPHSA